MGVKITDTLGVDQILPNAKEIANKIDKEIRQYLLSLGFEDYNGQPIPGLIEDLTSKLQELGEQLPKDLELKLDKSFLGNGGTILREIGINQNNQTGEVVISITTVDPVTGSLGSKELKFNTFGEIGEGLSEISQQIESIKSKIPDSASDQNPLVDRNQMASAIANNSAHRVTYDVQGNGFPTLKSLKEAGTCYYQGEPHVLDPHDYAIVLADEEAPEPFTGGQTRYEFDGKNWCYAYGISDKPFTDSEKEALDSGVTKEVVEKAKSAYQKPLNGIPSSDLSQYIRESLDKAENSVQQETGKSLLSNSEIEKLSTIQQYAEKNKIENIKVEIIEAGEEPSASIDGDRVANIRIPNPDLSQYQKKLVSGTNIKTINGKSILGEGDLDVAGADTVVTLEGDQEINGNKTFKNETTYEGGIVAKAPDAEGNQPAIRVSPRTTSNKQTNTLEAVATEPQVEIVAKAVEDLGQEFDDFKVAPVSKERLTEVPAENLTGEIPGTVSFPILNQNTSGKAARADKLETARKISITGGKITSTPASFDGTVDVSIEITGLSQNPADYPVFNQDTTGTADRAKLATKATDSDHATEADSADKLTTPRSLKVNLASENQTTTMFDGSADQEGISTVGLLPYYKLAKGSGTGTQRKVLATKATAENDSLTLEILSKTDIEGLEEDLNTKNTKISKLEERIDSLEQMGVLLGVKNTIDDLPGNISEITDKIPTINDFVTIRNLTKEELIEQTGKTEEELGLTGRENELGPSCFSIVSISESGDITWTYEFSYSRDLSGKLDKVGPGNGGTIPYITSQGDLGVIERTGETPEGSPTDINKETLISAIDKAYGSRQKTDKIGPSDIKTKTANPNSESSYTYDIDISGNAASADEATHAASADEATHATSSDNATLADKAKAFEVTTPVGSDERPVYIDSEGKPQPTKALGNLAFKDLPKNESGNNRYLIVDYRGDLDTTGNIEVLGPDVADPNVENFSAIEGGLLSEKDYVDLFYPYLLYVGEDVEGKQLPTDFNIGTSNKHLSVKSKNWVADEGGGYKIEIGATAYGYGSRNRGSNPFFIPRVRTFIVDSETIDGSPKTKLTETFDSSEIFIVSGLVRIYSNSNKINCLVMICPN